MSMVSGLSPMPRSKSILQNNLERSRDGVKDGPAITHANIGGAEYFH